MAASTQLISYLRSLGLTQEQIDALLAQAAGDANMDENAIADAARRMMQGGGGIPAPGTTTTVTPATPPGGAGGGSTAPLPPGQVALPYGAEFGLPTSYTPTAVGVQDYNAAVASGLLAGTFTPYQWAAAGRGQNPNNLPPSQDGGAGDGSPEARLPGMQYAGTVMASTLTPEQAASIQFNTPEYQAWLATQPTGTMELSANVLNNALLGGGYAGSQADLEASIVASHQEQWRRMQEVNPAITWEMYVRQVTPQVRDTLERATGLPSTTGAPSDPNQRGPQAGFYTGGTTTALPSTPSMSQIDRNTILANSMAQNQQYINNILAIPEAQRTPAQVASLAAAQERFNAQAAEQAAMRGTLQPAGSAAPAPVAPDLTTVTPPPATGGLTPEREAQLRAAVLKNDQYIKNINAVPAAQRTAAQNASLAAAQRNRDAQLQELGVLQPGQSAQTAPTAPLPPTNTGTGPQVEATATLPGPQNPPPLPTQQQAYQPPPPVSAAPPGAQPQPAPYQPPPPAPAPAPAPAMTTAPAPAPRPNPPPGFIETNMRYEMEILAIPEAKRTAAQKASLKAAQDKLAPYR